MHERHPGRIFSNAQFKICELRHRRTPRSGVNNERAPYACRAQGQRVIKHRLNASNLSSSCFPLPSSPTSLSRLVRAQAHRPLRLRRTSRARPLTASRSTRGTFPIGASSSSTSRASRARPTSVTRRPAPGTQWEHTCMFHCPQRGRGEGQPGELG